MKNLGYLVYFISLLVISSFSHNAVGQEVVITTSEGVMKARLYENVPNHVKTFIERARSGAFDGTLFSRVIPGFIIQGGSPDSRNASPGARIGYGDRSSEIMPEMRPEYFFKKGTLAITFLFTTANSSLESYNSAIEFDVLTACLFKSVNIC